MVKSKKFAWLSIFMSLLLVFHVFLPSATASAQGIKDEQTAEGDYGMVVTAHPLASEVGADVLKNGGNAIDAAVAIQFALNVNEPMMSGIGGGGFLMYYDADAEDVSVINSRERAPSSAAPDMFLGEDGEPMPFEKRVRSGKSVGVPGTLKGLEKALDQWGTRSMAELLEPSIEMAEEGVEVNWVLANAIESNEEKLSNTAAKEVFLPDGKPLEEGEMLVQEDLAKTFRLIAEHGTDVFYNGEIGEALAEEVGKRDSSMTSADLSNYDVTHEEPVWGEYKGYDIASMAPPSSGGLTLQQMLDMFEEMNLTQHGVKSAEKYHLMAEVMHLAYADRGAYMGDPEFVDVPAEGLLHPDYIEERVDTIDPNQANDNVQPGNPWEYQEGEPSEISEKVGDKTNGQTTHFTVADSEGNLVSYTTTIEQVFGSGIMVPGYGIMLNNELTDFDAVPGGANQVEPNKRPLSSMTPAIVLEDGEPFMTVGSPGGTTIITSVLQTIVNVIGYDMELKAAIEEPKIFSSSYPSISWETGIPSDVREQLASMGHEWESEPGEIGNVNSLMIDSERGTYFGAADSTREGKAIGISADDLPPEKLTVAYLQYLVEELADDGEFNDETAIRQAEIHLEALAHYESTGTMDKAAKHLNGFKSLLGHQIDNDLISEDGYEELKEASNNLLDEWK
ncbi:MAG TPA: gamma-glutamyltransferase [Lentibacillus sp.]|uniref:gamma-glutamyltransferase n=1 Tax=Lentibacillus sp. TaxID=1925746 RepID=UPI002B4ABF8D|nr:gamma-glutamyltransferase [Lentibacillus sp.]HLR63449.1 gamma-glutamyltransferase [Lentibacillus sp.]